MNMERMQYRGQLAELKYQFKELEVEASGLVVLLRNLINPFLPAVELDSAKIEKAADKLHEAVTSLKVTSDKIKEIEEVLR